MNFDIELVIPSLVGEDYRRVKIGHAWVNQQSELMVSPEPVSKDTIEDMKRVSRWIEGAKA